MIHPLTQTCLQETCSNSGAGSIGMTLSQRTGGVLNPSVDVYLGMSWRGTAPLAELF